MKDIHVWLSPDTKEKMGGKDTLYTILCDTFAYIVKDLFKKTLPSRPATLAPVLADPAPGATLPIAGAAEPQPVAAAAQGAEMGTTTRAPELPRKSRGRGLPHFPASYAHDYVETLQFENVYDYCHAPADGIMHAMDMKIGCKSTLVRSFGDTSKGHTFALHGAGARAVIVKTELDPICALPTCVLPLLLTTILVSEFGAWARAERLASRG
jgi:S-adenosylhomocysteine hydrolase